MVRMKPPQEGRERSEEEGEEKEGSKDPTKIQQRAQQTPPLFAPVPMPQCILSKNTFLIGASII